MLLVTLKMIRPAHLLVLVEPITRLHFVHEFLLSFMGEENRS
ncbi:hypothetical protein P3X46_030003 [Hevea brasiliensis]|uniref:HIT domain-containing protein n=1 Tax=Hevea brasiliensis TaxID=3981 RepID=A0ABQ9KXF1_HEVBR|nr:hypothetical protein P3X46_030003 [Hevea brasiliensis]